MRPAPSSRARPNPSIGPGIYPAPFHPSPNISRVDLNKVRAVVRKAASETPEAA
jgi:hypothetical protein